MMILALASCCSPAPGWVASTLEDQVKYAGAIVKGTVSEVIGDINESSVVLQDAVFYRGKGPSEITVEGYSNSALCGVGPSEVGTEVFVFLCRKDGAWILNNINLFTGSVEANDDNKAIVEEETVDEWRSEGSDVLMYKACGKPEPKKPEVPKIPCYVRNKGRNDWTKEAQNEDEFWKKIDERAAKENVSKENEEEEGDNEEEEYYDYGWGDDDIDWENEEDEDKDDHKELDHKTPITTLIGMSVP